MSQNRSSIKTALRMMGCAVGLSSMAMAAHATCSAEPFVASICMTAAQFCPNLYLEADGRVLQTAQYQALFSLIGGIYGGNGSSTFALPDLRGRAPTGLGIPMNTNGTQAGPTNVQLGARYGSEIASLSTANLAPHSHGATLAPSAVKTNISLPVTGTFTPGTATATATVSVNAMTTQTTGASAAPSATANTLGKVGNGQAAFYPYDSTKAVPVPATATVTVTPSGGSFSGNAAGDVTLTPSGTITVAPTGAGTPFPVVAPRIGLRMCIAVNGLYPDRP